MKTRFSNFILFVSLFCMTTSISSCVKDTETAEVDYDILAASAVKEFLDFAKNPRLGFNLDQAQEYLMAWAGNHGFSCDTDAAQNVWIDVPAVSGLEDYPRVILQGHMDMVCASNAGEDYDYSKIVGEPFYEGNMLRGKKVNLGVDDGIGVGAALALAASDIPHGPLRLLLTANEDYGMVGAHNLDPAVLNADYLINIDNDALGEIIVGCAGGFTKEFTGSYPTSAPVTGDMKITFSVSALKGGHSGIDIDKGHLSASAVLGEIVTDVILPSEGQLMVIECGTYQNAIPVNATVSFYVKHEKTESVTNQLRALVDEYKADYPEERAIWEIESYSLTADDKLCPSQTCADLACLFNQIAQGPIEKNEDGRTTKSNNIGIISLRDGELLFNTMPRSDYNGYLESEKLRFDSVASGIGMNSTLIQAYPAWEYYGDTKLSELVETVQNMESIASTNTLALQGVEPAIFLLKKPKLQCVSLGPTYENAHSINEALNVDTVKPMMKVLTNVLFMADEL